MPVKGCKCSDCVRYKGVKDGRTQANIAKQCYEHARLLKVHLENLLGCEDGIREETWSK